MLELVSRAITVVDLQVGDYVVFWEDDDKTRPHRRVVMPLDYANAKVLLKRILARFRGGRAMHANSTRTSAA